jgi:hypothetical protein
VTLSPSRYGRWTVSREISPIRAASPFRRLGWHFLAWSLVWLAFSGLAASFSFQDGVSWSPPPSNQWRWLLLFWSLAVADLFSTGLTVESVLDWMNAPTVPFTESKTDQEVLRARAERLRAVFRTIFWGTQKTICLAAWVVVLMRAETAPNWSVFLGVSTLVVVPLLGGLSWHFRERGAPPLA